jgi:hypothetical protein
MKQELSNVVSEVADNIRNSSLPAGVSFFSVDVSFAPPKRPNGEGAADTYQKIAY